ncbi:TraL protein [Rhodanobacter denitrificans]|uniref:TraL protein n=1 Tax=Rhodanobacter denitrificans TaxID=666685 RepID=M4NN34_9GAMM|nr:TraL protein [Rhodanobacter denitrificans]AGG89106.1 TraL protein [Rhodanobacter denitrificans]UJJ52931.1 type IV conjugative transfer system protein TraL [Rhodanobacter denitrificans]
METVELPVHLDDPKYFLVFTIEDAMLFIGAMGLGVLLHALGYLMLIGFGVSYLSSRFRGAVPEGRLQHILYWHGVPIGSGHSLINPYARRFIG